MSAEWNLVRLEEITSVLGDGLHGTPKYDESGDYFFINGNNLRDGSIVIDKDTKRASKSEYQKHRKELNDKTILVSINGTIGNVAFYNGENVFLGKSACYFNIVDGVDKQYVRYILTSNRFQGYIRSFATGTTIKNVSLKSMREFEFPLPLLSVQHGISEILSSLDEKIELNRKQNRTLEAIAQALFKRWFVEFEFPDENGRPYQSSGGAMQPSELGEIPVGWDIGSMEDICSRIFSGGTPATNNESYWGGEIPWLSSGETRRRIIVGTEKTITQAGVENSSTRIARKGAIVIASAGQGKTRGQTSYLSFDSYINQSVVALEADNKKVVDSFVFFNLAPRYEELRQLSDSQSIRGSLTTKLLQQLATVVPTRDVVVQFDSFAGAAIDKIVANENQNSVLARLRDTLLPKLMSGELRVA